MKKTLLMLLVAGSMLTPSLAFLYVDWRGPSGFTMLDGTTPLVPDPSSALVQLIYSPDNIAGEAYEGGIPTNDVVLAEAVISESTTGNPYGAGFSFTYGPAPDLVGFLYVRVFAAGTSPGVVPVNTYYYTGPLFATVVNPGPPSVPNDVNAGLAGAGDGEFGTFRLTQQVVPEPSVLALAALGAAVVAVRRFRRS